MLLVNDSHHFNCVLLQLVSLIKKNNQGNILLPIMLHIYVGFFPQSTEMLQAAHIGSLSLSLN